MKSILTLGLFGLLAAIASAQPEITSDQLVIHREKGGPGGESKLVAYLGVGTVPISGTLSDQLGLPEHIGLVVSHVAQQSPAADVFKVHDILTKLDDQWLVEPTQFAVLVRNHKEGDEVAITYLRGGKSAVATVKLAHQMAPDIPMGELGDFEFRPGPGDHARANVLFKAMSDGKSVHGNGQLMLKSGNGNSVQLITDDGNKTLIVTTPDGKEAFSGPVDTEAQKKALPPEVAKQFEEIEHLKGVHPMGPGGGGGGGFGPVQFSAPPPPDA